MRYELIIALVPLVTSLLALFYMPTLTLVYYSVYDRVSGVLTHRFYVDVLLNPVYASIVVYSLGVAFLTTIATLLIAFPVALYISLYSRSLERFILLVIFITPFWIDFLLRAWALKNLLYMVGIREGFLAMLIGMIYDFLPFMLLPLYISLARIHPNVVDAARTLGASTLDILARIIVPYALPGITVGSSLVFLLSLTELVIPQLLGSVSGFTVGPLLYSLILAGDDWSRGAALSLIVTLMTVLVIVLVFRVFRGATLEL